MCQILLLVRWPKLCRCRGHGLRRSRYLGPTVRTKDVKRRSNGKAFPIFSPTELDSTCHTAHRLRMRYWRLPNRWGQRCSFTNCSRTIDCREVRNRFEFQTIRIMNDFEATALSLSRLIEQDVRSPPVPTRPARSASGRCGVHPSPRLQRSRPDVCTAPRQPRPRAFFERGAILLGRRIRMARPRLLDRIADRDQCVPPALIVDGSDPVELRKPARKLRPRPKPAIVR
jgi:Glucokinase